MDRKRVFGTVVHSHRHPRNRYGNSRENRVEQREYSQSLRNTSRWDSLCRKTGKPTAINNMKKDGLTIYTNDNRLIVQSDDMIQNIILFDLNGKTINHFNVNKCIFETTFGSNIPQILIVQVMHTNGNLSTCKIIR